MTDEPGIEYVEARRVLLDALGVGSPTESRFSDANRTGRMDPKARRDGVDEPVERVDRSEGGRRPSVCLSPDQSEP
jgi:hypothetical protein